MADEIVDAAKRAMQEKISRLQKGLDKLDREVQEVEKRRKPIVAEIDNLQQGIERLESNGKTEEPPVKKKPTCTKCNSKKVHKDGTYKTGGDVLMQRWKCLSCGKKFLLPMETFEIGAEAKSKPRGPTGKRTKKHEIKNPGITREIVNKLKDKLEAGESIIIQDFAKANLYSESNVWSGAYVLLEEDADKYERYKDISRKYQLRGIRPISEEDRLNAKKEVPFCPDCKKLLTPDGKCKVCMKEETKDE